MLPEALNLGRQIKHEIIDEKQGILDFVESYGFLGVCADLPLDEDFLDRSMEVYITDNPFDFPVGTMGLAEYICNFFPKGYLPNTDDKLGNLSRRGRLYDSIFSASYGEDMAWHKRYFLQLYSYFLACVDYGRERRTAEIVSEYQVKRLRYTVTAESKPTLQWLFPSLKSVIDMAMAVCVTATDIPLRVCKKCSTIYYNENARSEFCSGRCRNQWNVYRSRGKKDY